MTPEPCGISITTLMSLGTSLPGEIFDTSIAVQASCCLCVR
ncbi:hypothetical protein SXCC_00980 [Gluconacetobacter sp. SXCC-1]|nr:hypothetical protein SXCC_00980 [Gluconacetobacter sp. SXCC-1]